MADGFGLGFAGRTATDTRSELGARFDNQILLYPGAVLAMRARLAWAHDWVSDPVLGAVFQTLPGAGFIVNGATPAQNSALASAGVRTSARQRRLGARQVRRRVCVALDHVWRHWDFPIQVVRSLPDRRLLCPLGVIFDRDEASSRSRHVRCAPKAEVKSGYWHLPRWAFAS